MVDGLVGELVDLLGGRSNFANGLWLPCAASVSVDLLTAATALYAAAALTEATISKQHACCPPFLCCSKESAHFMFYHMTDQATCLLTADGQLAVDFIGRCATPLKPRICPCPCSATALRLVPLHFTASALQPPALRLTQAPSCLPLPRIYCPLTTAPQLLSLPCHSPPSPSWPLLAGWNMSMRTCRRL